MKLNWNSNSNYSNIATYSSVHNRTNLAQTEQEIPILVSQILWISENFSTNLESAGHRMRYPESQPQYFQRILRLSDLQPEVQFWNVRQYK